MDSEIISIAGLLACLPLDYSYSLFSIQFLVAQAYSEGGRVADNINKSFLVNLWSISMEHFNLWVGFWAWWLVSESLKKFVVCLVKNHFF